MANITLRWSKLQPLVKNIQFRGQPEAPFLTAQYDPESITVSLSASFETGDHLGDPRQDSLSYKGTTGRSIEFTIIANDYGRRDDGFKIHYLDPSFFTEIGDFFDDLRASEQKGTITERTIRWLVEATRPVKFLGDTPPLLDIEFGNLKIRGVITDLSYEITMADPDTRAPIRAEIDITFQEINFVDQTKPQEEKQINTKSPTPKFSVIDVFRRNQ